MIWNNSWSFGANADKGSVHTSKMHSRRANPLCILQGCPILQHAPLNIKFRWSISANPTYSKILYMRWNFVVRGRLFLYLRTVLYSSTDLLYMCTKQKHKADHGHKKGHALRAQEGHSSTGISRPRTEVLRTRAYFSAANTLLRIRASRGHLNLCGFTLRAPIHPFRVKKILRFLFAHFAQHRAQEFLMLHKSVIFYA